MNLEKLSDGAKGASQTVQSVVPLRRMRGSNAGRYDQVSICRRILRPLLTSAVTFIYQMKNMHIP